MHYHFVVSAAFKCALSVRPLEIALSATPPSLQRRALMPIDSLVVSNVAGNFERYGAPSSDKGEDANPFA